MTSKGLTIFLCCIFFRIGLTESPSLIYFDFDSDGLTKKGNNQDLLTVNTETFTQTSEGITSQLSFELADTTILFDAVTLILEFAPIDSNNVPASFFESEGFLGLLDNSDGMQYSIDSNECTVSKSISSFSWDWDTQYWRTFTITKYQIEDDVRANVKITYNGVTKVLVSDLTLSDECLLFPTTSADRQILLNSGHIFKSMLLAFHSSEMSDEDIKALIPPCTGEYEEKHGICIDSVLNVNEYVEEGTLSVEMFEKRLAYLEEFGDSTIEGHCYEDTNAQTFVSNLYFPKSSSDIYSLSYNMVYEDVNGDSQQMPLDYMSVDFTNATSNVFKLEFSYEQLEALSPKFTENTETSQITYSFYNIIKFYATENIEQGEILRVIYILSITLDTKTNASISLTTTQLEELEACGCVIRVEIDSAIVLYTDEFETLAGENPVIQMGKSAYLRHYITDSVYSERYNLKFNNLQVSYAGLSYIDYTEGTTNHCGVEICDDGNVYVSFKIPIVADDFSVQIISILQSKNRRRMLSDETEGLELSTSFTVVEGTVNDTSSTENTSNYWWFWALIGLVCLGCAIVGGKLIYDKINKPKGTYIESTNSQDISAQI